jgi:hypothetical protein
MYLRGPLMVKITGGTDDAARSLLRVALLSPQARILPMVFEKGGRIEEEALAEVCDTQACRLRTSKLDELAGELGVIVGTSEAGGAR